MQVVIKFSNSLDCRSGSPRPTPVNLNPTNAAGVRSQMVRCGLYLYLLSITNHFISNDGYPDLVAFLSPLPFYVKLI